MCVCVWVREGGAPGMPLLAPSRWNPGGSWDALLSGLWLACWLACGAGCGGALMAAKKLSCQAGCPQQCDADWPAFSESLCPGAPSMLSPRSHRFLPRRCAPWLWRDRQVHHRVPHSRPQRHCRLPPGRLRRVPARRGRALSRAASSPQARITAWTRHLLHLCPAAPNTCLPRCLSRCPPPLAPERALLSSFQPTKPASPASPTAHPALLCPNAPNCHGCAPCHPLSCIWQPCQQPPSSGFVRVWSLESENEN